MVSKDSHKKNTHIAECLLFFLRRNCVFCFAKSQLAQGVFPAYSDNTEVNAVDVCPARDLLAAADDAKTVRLLRYPVLRGGARGKAYTAHSSHVMNARFTVGVDPTRLITIGG